MKAIEAFARDRGKSMDKEFIKSAIELAHVIGELRAQKEALQTRVKSLEAYSIGLEKSYSETLEENARLREEIAVVEKLRSKGVRVGYCWKGHAKTKEVAAGYICPVCYKAAQERAKERRKLDG